MCNLLFLGDVARFYTNCKFLFLCHISILVFLYRVSCLSYGPWAWYWNELNWTEFPVNFSNQEPFVQTVFFWTLIRPAASAYELTYGVIEIWLIKPSSMSICSSVRTSVLTSSVRPSTKSFSDSNEIWCVGRGRWVMHDVCHMAWSKVKVNWSRSRGVEG